MPEPGGDDQTPGSDDGAEPEPDRPEIMSETLVNQSKFMCSITTTVVQFIHSYADYSVHMYGGDIALTPEQQAILEATSNQKSPFSIQNAVVRSVQYLWKNGIVYYTFDENLGEYVVSSCIHDSVHCLISCRQ